MIAIFGAHSRWQDDFLLLQEGQSKELCDELFIGKFQEVKLTSVFSFFIEAVVMSWDIEILLKNLYNDIYSCAQDQSAAMTARKAIYFILRSRHKFGDEYTHKEIVALLTSNGMPYVTATDLVTKIFQVIDFLISGEYDFKGMHQSMGQRADQLIADYYADR